MVHRLVKRFSLPALIAFLAGVLAIAASSSILAWSYRDQVHELKATLYERCEQRQSYDARVQAFRDSVQSYYEDLLPNIRHNAPDNAFYRRLVVRVEDVIAKAKLAQGAPTGCSIYR